MENESRGEEEGAGGGREGRGAGRDDQRCAAKQSVPDVLESLKTVNCCECKIVPEDNSS